MKGVSRAAKRTQRKKVSQRRQRLGAGSVMEAVQRDMLPEGAQRDTSGISPDLSKEREALCKRLQQLGHVLDQDEYPIRPDRAN